MTAITDQVRWRRVLNHIRADLKLDAYKPLPAIADLGAIESVIVESEKNEDCPANSVWLNFSVVPPGKIHIITNIICFTNPGEPTWIVISKIKDAVDYPIRRKKAPGESIEVIFNGKVTLNEGEKIQILFAAMALHDKVYADIAGFQIDKY